MDDAAKAHAALVEELTKQKQVLGFQKEIADYQNTIRTAQAKQLTDLTEGLGKIAKPAGEYKVSADGVGSPASLLQIAKLLDQLASDAAGKIKGAGEKGYVLAPATGFVAVSTSRLALFQATANEHQRRAAQLLQLLHTQAQLPLFKNDAALPQLVANLNALGATILASTGAELALAAPLLMGAVAGFFRSDTTERTFDAGLTDAVATSAVLNHLAQAPVKIWNSPAAYLSSLIVPTDFTQADVVTKQLDPLQRQTAKMTFALPFLQQESDRIAVAATAAEAALKEANARRVALIETQLTEKAPAATATQADLDHFKMLRDYREAQIKKLDAEVPQREERVAGLAAQARGLAVLLARFTDHVTKVDGFLATLAVKEGELPLIIALVGEEKFAKEATPPVQIEVKVAVDLGSTVTRKTLFWSTHYSNAVLALEYRVASLKGEVLRTGVLHRGIASELPKPGDLQTFAWDNRKSAP